MAGTPGGSTARSMESSLLNPDPPGPTDATRKSSRAPSGRPATTAISVSGATEEAIVQSPPPEGRVWISNAVSPTSSSYELSVQISRAAAELMRTPARSDGASGASGRSVLCRTTRLHAVPWLFLAPTRNS